MAQTLFTISTGDFLTMEIEDILLTASALGIEYVRTENNTILFLNINKQDFIALGQLAGVYVDN